MSASIVTRDSAGDTRERTPVPLIASLLIALLLLAAASLKILEYSQASSAAASAEAVTGVAGEAPSAWKLVLAALEAVIAAGIVVFHRRAWGWALASLMFGSMAGYVFLLMARGEASCGCFGSFSPPPVVMFTVDSLLAIWCATLATRWWGYAQKRGLVLTVAGVGSIVGATVASATTEAPVDSELNPLATLREMSVMDGATRVGHDSATYLVYIYQRECPACQQHYPGMHRFAQATENHPDIHGLLLEISEVEKMAEAEGLFLPKAAWEEVPVTLVMQNGQIRERYGRANTPSPRETYERLTGEKYDDLLARVPTDPIYPIIPGVDVQELERSSRGSGTDSAPTNPVPTNPVPTNLGPNASPGATVDPASDRAIDKGALVSKLRGMPRFAEIFSDEPGGVRHVLYAHTNCGTCIEYRRYLLEIGEMISDTIEIHPVMRDLLEDDGIAGEEWGGVHALLVFDGGVLQSWYGVGEVTENLPFELHEQIQEANSR